MPCSGGKHGALFCDGYRNWTCMICGESLDIHKYNSSLASASTREHQGSKLEKSGELIVHAGNEAQAAN